MELQIAEQILPAGILAYFELKKFLPVNEEFHFYLEEKNVHPEEYAGDKLTSKGFLDEIKVQDFPIRGKASYLFIKRRKWMNETTGVPVCRDWKQVAKGTRMTREFASFLKAVSRYQAGKLQ